MTASKKLDLLQPMKDLTEDIFKKVPNKNLSTQTEQPQEEEPKGSWVRKEPLRKLRPKAE